VSDIRFPEFLPSLEGTRYPFVSDATLSNGRVFLLEGTFLDAHLYAVNGTQRYYISKVIVTSSQYTILIGDLTNTTRLTGIVNLPVAVSTVPLKDENGRSGGLLLSDPSRLSVITTWGVGTHNFERKQTEFCVTCQVPIPDPGVTSFRLANGEVLSGKVWWVGEDGVMLSAESATDRNGGSYPVIRVDAVGDPHYLQRLCDPTSLFKAVNPIRMIRIKQDGVVVYESPPDEYGNLNLQMNDDLATDAALRVRTTAAGIVFEVVGTVPST